MRKYVLLVMLLVAELAYCRFSDEQLYNAYMSGNLDVWGQYIDAQVWSEMSTAERKRLLNYEYGYVPVLADQQRMEQARRYLTQYERHLSDMQPVLSKADYLSYSSAAHAYEYLLDKGKLLSDGAASFKLAKQAVNADNNNPIALTLRGNIDFYAPRFFGGDKQRALETFIKAERIMLADTAFRYLWNLPAIQLCIAQGYEKTGELEKALVQAQKVLKRHPHFAYLRDVYLPELKQKMQKK
ncbi:MAG: hypothetical protein MJZ75_03775 [Paludibacteraceae bacterium]|nr:hypothetical protein [Paludibacteraceae bacterium]